MTELEKSREIAKLMGISLIDVPEQGLFWHDDFRDAPMPYEPYDVSPNGRYQFAAILLKFPEVITMFVQVEGCGLEQCCGEVGLHMRPTQTNLLDAILRMNNKWQEEWND